VRYGQPGGPLAIAHRGGAGLASENTLEAFGRSYALGVRYLETDVRLTSDGQLIAFHDATLGRTTPDRGRVRMRTLAELTRIPLLGGGRIAPLARLLADFPDAGFALDVKSGDVVRPLARLLQETASADRVCVAGASDNRLRLVRDLVGPQLSTALGWRSLLDLTRGRGTPRVPAGCRYAHVPLRIGPVPVFDADVLARAHDAGLGIVVWTVDRAETMRRLLDLGVDGIITDRPDVLREVLIGRGQWTRPGSHETSADPSTDLVT